MIAVLSDSHIPARAEEIPEEFIEKVKQADLTVHCGDFEAEEVYRELEQYGELIGVKGNIDRFEVQNSATFERNNVEFGVYHGTGINPRGHHPTLVNIAEKLNSKVLLHGHTHHQEAVKKDGKLLLNPGSCTGVGGGSSKAGNPKMMVLQVDRKLKAKLIELENGRLKEKEKTFEV